LTFAQDFERFRSAGESMLQEVSRITEDFTMALQLHDFLPTMIRLALNQNAVTSNAAASGVAGFDEINLRRGPGKPNEVALLVRGASPMLAAGNAQFEIPRCFNSSSPELVFSKGVWMGIQLDFESLKATASPFAGRILFQDAVAL